MSDSEHSEGLVSCDGGDLVDVVTDELVLPRDIMHIFRDSLKGLGGIDDPVDWCSQARAKLTVIGRLAQRRGHSGTLEGCTTISVWLQAKLPLACSDLVQEEDVCVLDPFAFVDEVQRRFDDCGDPHTEWLQCVQQQGDDVDGYSRKFARKLRLVNAQLPQGTQLPAEMVRMQFLRGLLPMVRNALLVMWSNQTWTGRETVHQLTRLVTQFLHTKRSLTGAVGSGGAGSATGNGAPLPVRAASWSCYNCGKPGHMARDCTSSQTKKSGGGGGGGKCFRCGRQGHLARACTVKMIAVDEIVDPETRKQVESLTAGQGNGQGPTSSNQE